ncbi:hypothetical protein GBA65_15095 [Rubrobacter marinus]|uniref:Uncharacterized protein n=1 Tax=Rubrobacter marinus TaxID=2653852 RepID=A0A6G8PZM1_9ACTN|nr:hypothetical protein [Rubrobacter marinus]QIN79630.1 hypothetical protein GBA65_15095 [Rubrobacter marinus]
MTKRRSGRELRPEEDGNLAVALLLAPMLGALLMALWNAGAGDWSEASAWGIAVVFLCRWLDEKEKKHG